MISRHAHLCFGIVAAFLFASWLFAAAETPSQHVSGAAAPHQSSAISLQWPGDSITVTGMGKTVTAKIKTDAPTQLEVWYDDALTRLELTPDQTEYTLVSHDEPVDLKLTLLKSNVHTSPTIDISSLAIDGTAYVPRVPDFKILAIGDSITLGYGAMATNPSCVSPADQHAVGASYVQQIGRTTGAHIQSLAISGSGLVRNFNNNRQSTLDDILSNPQTLSNLEARAPDFILINIGTNDFYQHDPEPAFHMAYTRHVTALADRFPHARFLLVSGPMLNDADIANLNTAIRTGVDALPPATQRRVAFLPYRLPGDIPGLFGCDWHPSINGHTRMAAAISTFMALDLLGLVESQG